MLEDARKRHENEMRDLREQLAIEKESWEDMFMRKQQSKLKEMVGVGKKEKLNTISGNVFVLV